MTAGSFAEQLQAFFAQSLEAIRIVAGSERCAAQHFHALFGQRGGDGFNLFTAFNDAWASHGDDLFTSDDDVFDFDLRAFRLERARGKFIRTADANDFTDAFQQLQFADVSD